MLAYFMIRALTGDSQSTCRQAHVTTEMMAAASTKEAEIMTAIANIDEQIAEINSILGKLVLATQDPSETETDRVTAISQVAVQQTAFGESRELLNGLLSCIQDAVTNNQIRHDGMKIQFGNQNQGSQTGINHGVIHNTFGSRN